MRAFVRRIETLSPCGLCRTAATARGPMGSCGIGKRDSDGGVPNPARQPPPRRG